MAAMQAETLPLAAANAVGVGFVDEKAAGNTSSSLFLGVASATSGAPVAVDPTVAAICDDPGPTTDWVQGAEHAGDDTHLPPSKAAVVLFDQKQENHQAELVGFARQTSSQDAGNRCADADAQPPIKTMAGAHVCELSPAMCTVVVPVKCTAAVTPMNGSASASPTIQAAAEQSSNDAQCDIVAALDGSGSLQAAELHPASNAAADCLQQVAPGRIAAVGPVTGSGVAIAPESAGPDDLGDRLAQGRTVGGCDVIPTLNWVWRMLR
jgi:hypothetical protein